MVIRDAKAVEIGSELPGLRLDAEAVFAAGAP